MELLPDGKKNTVQVQYEDQMRINEFSKLIMRKDKLDADLARERTEKEYLDDVSLELELVDEDELVQYKLGEVFVFWKQSKVLEQLERDAEELDSRIAVLEQTDGELQDRMTELKTQLYAKFGDNINLER
ncbi:tubulin-binding prefolding complex subunit GIM3 KNAG_0F01470 [Huiozyma naganishii CBS 8797]|uniref:Prefoldin subunit 4 n=1 Tax=Huiozyma naganishii (strain ATCC MYA-139 / BCRC 22969 / CBS 8797 / KCTC 17520 / NBRC 10181 / NCYC 3082 / Yp74L-3) TaxID=1071383 RepID=J7R7G7_HUIN7|nr:hypothetical protein KNAG_0F01470 [Kazachstania naganishii CBS 8797]CCK70815.1 hypothetical protein KNAG_0F01470 [Kazachstania naganishii CBS 8797]